jgi:hypothetical protein
MNTTSGLIVLKINEWSKITKITRIHRGCMQHNLQCDTDKTRICEVLAERYGTLLRSFFWEYLIRKPRSSRS